MALERLRQQSLTEAMSEQEYNERAAAIAQELGIDVKADGSIDQLVRLEE